MTQEEMLKQLNIANANYEYALHVIGEQAIALNAAKDKMTELVKAVKWLRVLDKKGPSVTDLSWADHITKARAVVDDMIKCSGETTRQIKEAPEGALFICKPGMQDYAQNLASALGRQDLRIVSAGSITESYFRGKRMSIVIDHAAVRDLSSDAMELIYRARINMPESA